MIEFRNVSFIIANILLAMVEIVLVIIGIVFETNYDLAGLDNRYCFILPFFLILSGSFILGLHLFGLFLWRYS